MPVIVGITLREYFTSCASNKPYKLSLILDNVNNGDCSSMAEYATVARETRVRSSHIALAKSLIISQGSTRRVRSSPIALEIKKVNKGGNINI